MTAIELAKALHSMLEAGATGNTEPSYAKRYQQLREELRADQAVWLGTPECVRLNHDFASALASVKRDRPTYQERREFLRAVFQPFVLALEQRSFAPNDNEPSLDQYISRIYRVLRITGHRLAIGTLLVSTSRRWELQLDGYGWDHWILALDIPDNLYYQRPVEHWDERARELLAAAEEVGNPHPAPSTVSVKIGKIIPPVTDWEKDARAFVRGEGINNQGRVRSDNLASIEKDGLYFRSQPEINFYKAAKSAGLVFAPLPVFLQGGPSYRRLEPDFVIIAGGRVFVVEIDGDPYHLESPVDAHERTRILAHEGAHIERVRADQCATEERAIEYVKALSNLISKLNQNR